MSTGEVGRPLREAMTQQGFVFVPAARMREHLARVGPLTDWDTFVESWDDLRLDLHMADQGRYRRRRHATFAATEAGALVRQPHQPHYQGREYNPLNGGIERWFEPVAEDVGAGASLRTILRFCWETFGALASASRAWHIEVHQFRIEARPGEAGHPTPEGVHRDGVDYVLVLMIRRQNIVKGVTTIHAPDRRKLGSFTLTQPFDAALVEDARVYHGVTSVEAKDPSAPAYRDVLVVTFRGT